ncbi:hypothetical protein C8Q73DRAFT_669319 [Cubamyces lactineus]|nr:hypothetical protein C8Q73DRAFT_669319 [Cubamyces lactineus]
MWTGCAAHVKVECNARKCAVGEKLRIPLTAPRKGLGGLKNVRFEDSRQTSDATDECGWSDISCMHRPGIHYSIVRSRGSNSSWTPHGPRSYQHDIPPIDQYTVCPDLIERWMKLTHGTGKPPASATHRSTCGGLGTVTACLFHLERIEHDTRQQPDLPGSPSPPPEATRAANATTSHAAPESIHPPHLRPSDVRRMEPADANKLPRPTRTPREPDGAARVAVAADRSAFGRSHARVYAMPTGHPSAPMSSRVHAADLQNDEARGWLVRENGRRAAATEYSRRRRSRTPRTSSSAKRLGPYTSVRKSSGLASWALEHVLTERVSSSLPVWRCSSGLKSPFNVTVRAYNTTMPTSSGATRSSKLPRSSLDRSCKTRSDKLRSHPNQSRAKPTEKTIRRYGHNTYPQRWAMPRQSLTKSSSTQQREKAQSNRGLPEAHDASLDIGNPDATVERRAHFASHPAAQASGCRLSAAIEAAMRSLEVMLMPSAMARLSRATWKAREGCATPPQTRRAAEEKNGRHANRAAKLAQIEERETGEWVSKAVLDMGCARELEGGWRRTRAPKSQRVSLSCAIPAVAQGSPRGPQLRSETSDSALESPATIPIIGSPNARPACAPYRTQCESSSQRKYAYFSPAHLRISRESDRPHQRQTPTSQANFHISGASLLRPRPARRHICVGVNPRTQGQLVACGLREPRTGGYLARDHRQGWKEGRGGITIQVHPAPTRQPVKASSNSGQRRAPCRFVHAEYGSLVFEFDSRSAVGSTTRPGVRPGSGPRARRASHVARRWRGGRDCGSDDAVPEEQEKLDNGGSPAPWRATTCATIVSANPEGIHDNPLDHYNLSNFVLSSTTYSPSLFQHNVSRASPIATGDQPIDDPLASPQPRKTWQLGPLGRTRCSPVVLPVQHGSGSSGRSGKLTMRPSHTGVRPQAWADSGQWVKAARDFRFHGAIHTTLALVTARSHAGAEDTHADRSQRIMYRGFGP